MKACKWSVKWQKVIASRLQQKQSKKKYFGMYLEVTV